MIGIGAALGLGRAGNSAWIRHDLLSYCHKKETKFGVRVISTCFYILLIYSSCCFIIIIDSHLTTALLLNALSMSQLDSHSPSKYLVAKRYSC